MSKPDGDSFVNTLAGDQPESSADDEEALMQTADEEGDGTTPEETHIETGADGMAAYDEFPELVTSPSDDEAAAEDSMAWEKEPAGGGQDELSGGPDPSLLGLALLCVLTFGTVYMAAVADPGLERGLLAATACVLLIITVWISSFAVSAVLDQMENTNNGRLLANAPVRKHKHQQRRRRK